LLSSLCSFPNYEEDPDDAVDRCALQFVMKNISLS
jgi:hypothetical protein